MGWASGTEIMQGIIEAAQEHIPDDDERYKFYKKVVKTMQSHDWDTMDECLGEDDSYDELYEDLNPDLDTDEDEPDPTEDVLDRFNHANHDWRDDIEID